MVFQDISTDFAFLTRSTITAKDTIQWTDGKEYPLVKVEVSSQSHPFYTGKQKIVDTAGRVDRFPPQVWLVLKALGQSARHLKMPFILPVTGRPSWS